MTGTNSLPPLWQHLTPKLLKEVPKSLRAWLVEPSCLTHHLKAADPIFDLERLSQDVTEFDIQEARLLAESKPSKNGVVRQVLLKLNGQAKVYARVLIPETTLTQMGQRIDTLKDLPIGENLLFNNPKVKRQPFMFRKITTDDPLYASAFKYLKTTEALWARCSVFNYEGHPLLITEVFAPNCPPYRQPKAKLTAIGRLKQQLKDTFLLLRLHRPLPLLLQFWPVLWALLLAAGTWPKWSLIAIFIAGTVVMRSAAVIVNDLADRRLDPHVERTRYRPLAQNYLSTKYALGVLIALLFIALSLVSMLNTLCFELACIGLILAGIYPLMKRVTHYPQVVLGMAFNWGIVMAYAATSGHVPIEGWLLWLIACIWTIAYDSQYAMADREDDVHIGIKSTAILFGRHVYRIIALLQGITLLALLLLGWMKGFSLIYDLMIGASVGFFVLQYRACLQSQYIKAFNDNHWFGAWVLIALILQYGLGH